jgi:uncharacterized protein
MIIDSHMHLGSIVSTPCVDESIEAVIALMDHLDVEFAISTSFSLLDGRSDVGINTAREAYSLSQGRILAYTYVNPHYPDDVKIARECLDDERFVGIKIHPSGVACFGNDVRWEPVWQLASEYDVPILAHSWALSDYNPSQRFSTPDLFEHYVGSFPDVNLILGHAGGRYEGYIAAANLARNYSNVYADLSGDSYSFGLVEWLVNHIGADRILYGSDLTMIEPRTQIGRILDADISIEAKAKIMGENAAQLFGIGQ